MTGSLDLCVVLLGSLLLLIPQKIGPQHFDDGKIEIVGFWASTFVSLQ